MCRSAALGLYKELDYMVEDQFLNKDNLLYLRKKLIRIAFKTSMNLLDTKNSFFIIVILFS